MRERASRLRLSRWPFRLPLDLQRLRLCGQSVSTNMRNRSNSFEANLRRFVVKSTMIRFQRCALPVSVLPVVLTLILALTCRTVLAADQPQWGQAWSRNMVSDERNLPDSFDPKTGKNVKWTAKLGNETHSTPVVAGGRVYLGTNNGEPRDPKHQGDRGVLMCFGERDGKLLWQLVVPKREEDPYFDWPKCGISSPVTVEGARVYIVSNRGEVVCLDPDGLANGNDGPFREEGAHMTPNGKTPMQTGPLDADILWLF